MLTPVSVSPLLPQPGFSMMALTITAEMRKLLRLRVSLELASVGLPSSIFGSLGSQHGAGRKGRGNRAVGLGRGGKSVFAPFSQRRLFTAEAVFFTEMETGRGKTPL